MPHRWFHRKVVNEIKTFIGADRTLCNLRKETAPAITLFDKVIVDGSMHTRQIQKKLREFCKTNQKERLKTKIDLFICCMEEGKKAYAELEQVYSSELIYHAKVITCLGGEFNLEKMNFTPFLFLFRFRLERVPDN